VIDDTPGFSVLSNSLNIPGDSLVGSTDAAQAASLAAQH